MNYNKFKNILTFLIIVNGPLVLNSSPDYIWEKYLKYIGTYDGVFGSDNWRWGLDSTNTALFEEYIKKWKVNEEE